MNSTKLLFWINILTCVLCLESLVINSKPEISFMVSPIFSWNNDNSTSQEGGSDSKTISWNVTSQDVTSRFHLEYDIVRNSNPAGLSSVQSSSISDGNWVSRNKCGGQNGAMKPVEILTPVTSQYYSIPRNVTPGMSIRVQGKTHPAVSMLNINLVNGTNEFLDNDIIFQIGIRKGPETQKNIVFHSYIGKKWAEDKKTMHKLFLGANEFFDALITMAEEHFMIFINGVHVINFKYREGDLTRVSRIYLGGDTTTYYRIRFEDSVE